VGWHFNIKSRDPQALSGWHRDHLGVPYKEGEGTEFSWNDGNKIELWQPLKKL
jgi:hypothetical protein